MRSTARRRRPPRAERRLHVAFTMAGLRALQIDPERLDRLPPEFDEGMEPRAGLLGDVRGNHPDHWRRPLRHGVDPRARTASTLSAVHVAVMLRCSTAADPGHALHPRWPPKWPISASPARGCRCWRWKPRAAAPRKPDGREHFGFVDGISQPIVAANRAPDRTKHEVRPGELVLGFTNDRGDGPCPAEADGLLDHGSFLVVRKLRQRLDHLNVALEQRRRPSQPTAPNCSNA